jgi:hypothetical protein
MNNEGAPPTPGQASGRRFFIVDEEQLRQKILELSPEIRRDTQRMEDIIHELVSLEREKLGLDRLSGDGQLRPKKDKLSPGEPDFIGEAKIAGRFYRIQAVKASDRFNAKFLKLKFCQK